ncbi:hypothetical protein CRENBAI_018955 [Crenichthys baileyi]|uniref:Uncharacterized protein n=1 Tax=Crenichthys baileyi TaxID=28760 RepID=A0AAV9SC23_9TELE
MSSGKAGGRGSRASCLDNFQKKLKIASLQGLAGEPDSEKQQLFVRLTLNFPSALRVSQVLLNGESKQPNSWSFPPDPSMQLLQDLSHFTSESRNRSQPAILQDHIQFAILLP